MAMCWSGGASWAAVGVLLAAATAARADDQAAGDPFAANPDATVNDPFGGGRVFGPADEAQLAERRREQERLRERAAAPGAFTQPVYWAEPRSEVTSRVRQALSQSVTSVGIDFTDVPLEEAVDFLRDEYGIEVLIDEAALDDLGIGTDEPIACNLRNISLKSALRLMLKQLELTCVISDEVLLITTEEEAETRLSAGVYPVGDLVEDQDELRELARVITTTVARETWARNKGGQAELETLSSGFLVITQTQAVHERVIELLTALRRARAHA